MPPAGPQAQGWIGKCKSSRCQYLAEVGFILSPLAIGQAKPAARRVADARGWTPREEVARTRQCGRQRAPGRRAPENSPAGTVPLASVTRGLHGHT